MLSEICHEINNYFCVKRLFGTIRIVDGKISDTSDLRDESGRPLSYYDDSEIPVLQDGQYFRIVGSVFNDGVHRVADDEALVDEVFEGAIWTMAVPPSFLLLVKEITDWQTKYGDATSSPFQSESFGGYSYQKGGSDRGGTNQSNPTWQDIFYSRLSKWRKVRNIR